MSNTRRDHGLDTNHTLGVPSAPSARGACAVRAVASCCGAGPWRAPGFSNFTPVALLALLGGIGAPLAPARPAVAPHLVRLVETAQPPRAEATSLSFQGPGTAGRQPADDIVSVDARLQDAPPPAEHARGPLHRGEVSLVGGAPFEGQIRFESDNELRRWGGLLGVTGDAEPPVLSQSEQGRCMTLRAMAPGARSERLYRLRHFLTGQNGEPGNVENTTRTFRLGAGIRFGADGPVTESSRLAILRLDGPGGVARVELSATTNNALRVFLRDGATRISAQRLAPEEWRRVEVAYAAATPGQADGWLRVFLDGVEVSDLSIVDHAVTTPIADFAVQAEAAGTLPGARVECEWVRWSHREAWALDYDAHILHANLRDVSQTEARLLCVQDPAGFNWAGAEALVEHCVGPWPGEGSPQVRTSPPVPLLEENGYAGALAMTGLAPGSLVSYRVVVRDPAAPEGAVVSPVSTFATLGEQPGVVRLGWFSCHEQSAGAHPFDIYTALESRGVDFIVNLGDFHYNDSQPTLPYPSTRGEIMASLRSTMLDLSYASTARRVPMFNMLDDHDVWSNNADDTWRNSDDILPDHGGVTEAFLFAEGMAAWQAYFRGAMIDPAGVDDSYRSWETARTLFVLLDTRTHQRRGQGTMLGQPQRAWLLDLLGSTSKPNVVLFSPSVWGDVQDFRDNWEGGGTHTQFHAERAAIEGAIDGNAAIERVAILSGDRHCSFVHTRVASPKILFESAAGPASNNVYTQYSAADAALPGVLFCTTNGAPTPPQSTPPGYAHMGGRLVIDETAGVFTVEILDADDGDVLHASSHGAGAEPGDVPGDTNGDGLVNFEDLNNVLAAYGAFVPEGSPADLDDDGFVGFADLNIVLGSYNQ